MSGRMTQSLALPRDWWNFTIYQAVQGLRRQYARTKLGPIWIVMTQFALIGGIALVFSSVFNQPLTDYLPFISASIITWNLISPTITQAPTVFVAGYSIIQSFGVPFAIFPIQMVLNNSFVFLHGVAIHLFVLYFTGKSVFYVPLGLLMALVLVLIIYPFVSVLGILGARFRDLTPAVGSIMYLFFLITPVIWEKKALTEDRYWLVHYNPFAHMMEAVRGPLTGRLPETESIIVCVVMAIVSVAVGEAIFRRFARPLPFWV